MKLFEKFPLTPNDKFSFESENFQSENKAHAFYIEVKKRVLMK